MTSRFCSLRLAGLLALSLPVLIAADRAYAQESVKDANAQYRKAFDALAQKKWPEARRLLLALWGQSHTWDVAAGLGQAEFLLENRAAGATYTAFAVANVPPRENTKTVERLRAALNEMREAVGTVRVVVNKDGAEIVVEQQVVGSSPLTREIYLNPGRRLLEARLANGGHGQQTLEVQAGKSYRVALIVEPPPSEPGPSSRAVSSNSAPTSAMPPAPPADQRGTSRTWTPVFITGGLALAAAAVGTGFAIDAQSAKNDGEKALSNAEAEFGSNPCTPAKGGGSELCQSVNELQDRRKSSNTAATASFIAGGVFALAAVGSYFLWAKPS